MRRIVMCLALASAGCSATGMGRALEGGGLFGNERCAKLSVSPAPVTLRKETAPASAPCPDRATLDARLEWLFRRGHWDRAQRLAQREWKRCPALAEGETHPIVQRIQGELEASMPADPDVLLDEGFRASRSGDAGRARMCFDAALIKLERKGEGTPHVVAIEPIEKETVRLLQFSLDGGRLVLAGELKYGLVVDLQGDGDMASLFRPTPAIDAPSWVLGLSPDGKYAARRAGDALEIYTTRGDLVASLSGHEQRSDYSEAVHSAAFFWDSSRVLTGDEKGTLRAFRLPEGGRVTELPALRDDLDALAVSPDGRFVATAFEGEAAVRIRSVDGRATYSILPTNTDEIRDIAWAAGGKYLAAAPLFGAIDTWDLSTCRHMTITDKPPCHKYPDGSCGDAGIFGLAISPSGARVAAAFHDVGYFLWDGRTGKRLAVVPMRSSESRAWGVAFSHDERLFAASGSDETQIFRLTVDSASTTIEPLVSITMLANGEGAFALDRSGRDGLSAYYDASGRGDASLACQIGRRKLPLEVCEGRLHIPGLVGKRARGLPVDPLDADPPR